MIFESPPQLTRLMQNVVGVDSVSVIARSEIENGSLPLFDVHAPLMSLPLLLGLPDPTAALPHFPYISVEENLQEPGARQFGNGERLKVGLAWECAARKTLRSQAIDPIADTHTIAAMRRRLLQPAVWRSGKTKLARLRADRSDRTHH